MSFGWSAGDIVSAITLVNQIITCVSNAGGAREHFQELESELGGLQKALKEIEELTRLPDQIPEIFALKFAACLCEETLKRFYEKIKPFDKSLGASSRKSRIKAAPRMVRWELLVKKDVPELRTYLVAHVGYLNMRLNTALLKLGARTLADNKEHHNEQLRASNAIEQQLSTNYTHLSTQTQTIVEKIAVLAQQDSAPRLDSLFALATNVWKAQHEMMEMCERAIQSVPPPDLSYTWAQAPIKFEDALGRVIPVPSEYNWDKFEAIIQAQFKNGPGSAKVRSGEYELFMGMVSVTPLKNIDFRPPPGSRITMTFIVGQYIGSERCPRPRCNSRSFRRDDCINHGLICMECQSWFHKSRAMLPKPLKPPAQTVPLRRDEDLEQDLDDKYSKLDLRYHDRRVYKNLSIYITDLPPTPARFRDKYTRNHRLNNYFQQSIGKVDRKASDRSDAFYRKENNQPPKKIQHTDHREFVPGFERLLPVVPKAQALYVPPIRLQTHQMRFIPHEDLILQRPGTFDPSIQLEPQSYPTPALTQNAPLVPINMPSQPEPWLNDALYLTQNAPSVPINMPSQPEPWLDDALYLTQKAPSAPINMPSQLDSCLYYIHPLRQIDPLIPIDLLSQQELWEHGIPAVTLTRIDPLMPTFSPRTSTYVVALTDYDANEVGELSFRKGDIIIVLESASEDWWRGFLNEQVGIFPIEFVNITLPSTNIPSRLVRARWSYKARDTDELSFEKGDIIIKLQSSYEGWQKGFLQGQLGKGQFGIFPLNFVEGVAQGTQPCYPLIPANGHGQLLESNTLNAPQESDNYAKDATPPDVPRRPHVRRPDARFGISSLMWPVPQECEDWIPGPTGPRPPPSPATLISTDS